MRAAAPLIAVLGLGEAGVVHARALLAAGARVGVASKRGATFPHADAVYPDYEAALKDPEVSGVVIATPYASHPELIRAAADAGKHILCEKPLGACTADILRARDSARTTRFAAGFMRRWDPAYRAARDRLEGDELGAALVLKCTSGDKAYPEKYLRDDAEPPQGAMFRDLAVHDIDLARWLLRDEVASVFAAADALVHPRISRLGDVDTAVAVLSMKKGARAVLVLSRALGYGHKICTEVVGSRGSVEIGDVRRTDVRWLVEGNGCVEVFEDFRERFEKAFERQMKGFVDLVKADEEGARKLVRENCSYASFDDGVRATLVAEALCKSAESGKPVDVQSFEEVVDG